MTALCAWELAQQSLVKIPTTVPQGRYGEVTIPTSLSCDEMLGTSTRKQTNIREQARVQQRRPFGVPTIRHAYECRQAHIMTGTLDAMCVGGQKNA